MLKQLRLNEKIFTCSHTLELLIKKYQTLNEDNESLTKRIELLETENFNLKKERNNQEAVIGYLKEQGRMKDEKIDRLLKENQQYVARLEYVSRQRDEVELM